MGLTPRDWYRTVYLKSSHWLRLRELALALHGRKCAKCNTKKRLDVHHLRYKNIYDVVPADLQVLCRTCHDLEHAPKPKETTVITKVVVTIETKKSTRKRRRRERQESNRKKAGLHELPTMEVLIEKFTKQFKKETNPRFTAIQYILRTKGWAMTKQEKAQLRRLREAIR